MRLSKFHRNSPEVIDILSGVYRHNKTYFRVIDGKCEIYAARQRLMDLGIGAAVAARILDAAEIPAAPYVCNKPVPMVARIDADLEIYEVAPPAAPEPPTPARPARRGPAPMTAEEREEKAAKAEKIANDKRYHLVRQGRYFGCYDGLDGTQVLFTSRDEALEHIGNVKRGRDAFKIFYSGGKRHE